MISQVILIFPALDSLNLDDAAQSSAIEFDPPKNCWGGFVRQNRLEVGWAVL